MNNLNYGVNVESLLHDLSQHESGDIGEFEVYGEDENGCEGSASIDITLLAADALNLIKSLRDKLDAVGPIIQVHDLKALLRFDETSEDGEGYDIGSDAMSRLVELGLASKGSHGIRAITPFGRWVIERNESEISDNTLKTEDDINSDFAVKMAKLRSGTHDTADKAG